MTPEAQRQINSMQNKIDTLEESVIKLTDSVNDLVLAWNTAKGMTSFVKWIGSIAAGAAVLYNFLSHWGPK